MKRLYRGDTSFLPAVKPGPVGMVVRSIFPVHIDIFGNNVVNKLQTAALRYSGFQVAYTLWGTS